MELSERLKALCDIVESATPLLLEGYARVPGADPLRREHLGIQTKKSVKDLVTVFDQRVEAFLTAELARRFPGEAIVGEEAVAASGRSVRETCEQHDAFWIIDPIDGTTNFLHGIPMFAISIGLEREGQLVAGVIYNPIMDELFTAERGKGAYLNDKRIRVSARKAIGDAVVATGIPHRGRPNHPRFHREIEAVCKAVAGVRRTGAASLDLAWTAAGRFDAYWEHDLKPWDIAAGIVICREAGGLVTDIDGGDSIFSRGDVLAGNSSILKALTPLLAH